MLRRRIALFSMVLLIAGGLLSFAPVAGEAQQQAPAAQRQEESGKRSTRTSPRRRRIPRSQGQRQPTPERLREIQQALIGAGYLAGEPTGKWDAASAEAMRRFQRANGRPETGKADARSLIKLGLGPETAGKAAPRPPPNGETPPKPRQP